MTSSQQRSHAFPDGTRAFVNIAHMIRIIEAVQHHHAVVYCCVWTGRSPGGVQEDGGAGGGSDAMVLRAAVLLGQSCEDSAQRDQRHPQAAAG